MLKKPLALAMLLLMSLATHAGEPAPRRVLFLCTGNFFRSAFAEQYFNALAARNRQLGVQDPRRQAVPWIAESRGLDPAQLSPSQRAARMSGYAVERLRKLRIAVAVEPGSGRPAHTPTLLTMDDLVRCDRIIAMHDPTHRPMLDRFIHRHRTGTADTAALKAKVVYWNIADVVPGPAIPVPPARQAAIALDEIQKAVDQLFAGLCQVDAQGVRTSSPGK